MKIQKKMAFFLFTFLLFSLKMTSQELKLGVNEWEYFYSDHYTTPTRIDFVFNANPKYKIFYSRLETKIKEVFSKKNIEFSLRYLGKEVHYNANSKAQDSAYSFYLNIDETHTIDERSGSDRIVKFDFNGKLRSKDGKVTMLSFKTVVLSIHDITERNEEVANYLLSKLVRK